MEFRNDKAIYLQIADYVYDKVISKDWQPGERIPSVREISALLEVNVNTAMRTYTALQDADIVVNKRGVGFFLTENCYQRSFELRKNEFVSQVLPLVLDNMLTLGITIAELSELYTKHIENKKK